MKKITELISKAVALVPDAQDVVTFGGIAAACYGVAQIYEPGAWILGGAALFYLGVRR